MDPPVCRLCEHKHWSWQGHLFPVAESVPRPAKPPAKPFPGAKREAKAPIVSDETVTHVTHPSPKPAGKSRTAKWRAAHPELHAKQQAAARKRKRAKLAKGAKP